MVAGAASPLNAGMDHHDVDEAVAAMTAVLGARTGRDWRVPAGPLEWDCRETAAHIGHDLLAYAGQLAGRPPDHYLPFDLVVRPGTAADATVRVAAACGTLLSLALAAAGPDTRAWHHGPCDPAGFAAMTVVPEGSAFRTINLNVQFIRIGRAHPLLIEAMVVSATKSLIVAEVVFLREDGELIARASAQQLVVPFTGSS